MNRMSIYIYVCVCRDIYHTIEISNNHLEILNAWNIHKTILYIWVPIKACFPFCPHPLNWLIQLLVIMDLIMILVISPALLPPCREVNAII